MTDPNTQYVNTTPPGVDRAETAIGLVSNLWSKMLYFKKAGDMEPGHKHLFGHMTLLATGKLRVNVDGTTTDFEAPHMIYIKAGKLHELTALVDGTLAYCIHALRDGDTCDDIIDPASIPDGVTPVHKPLVEV